MVRTPFDFSDEVPDRLKKLQQQVIDFDALSSFKVPGKFDVAFCAIGLREPSKASKDEFVKVDVSYAGNFAKICKSAGVRHFSLVSAVNSSPKAGSRFGRTKYKAEVAVTESGFEKRSVFRPSILKTTGTRYGFRDKMFQEVAPKFTGILSTKYKEVRVEDVARAMVTNMELNANRKGDEVLEWDDFQRLWAMERFEYDRNTSEAIRGGE